MEARAHPRSQVSLPVNVHCSQYGEPESRKSHNISLGGIFIQGRTCAPAGQRLDISLSPRDQQTSARIATTVCWVGPQGFSLCFTRLDPTARALIEELISPTWDGENLYEGLLIAASRSETTGFGDWLRLASVVCSDYQRTSRNRVLSKRFRTLAQHH